jgi:hypothetical protein
MNTQHDHDMIELRKRLSETAYEYRMMAETRLYDEEFKNRAYAMANYAQTQADLIRQ